MATLSAGNLTNLRSTQHKITPYLSVLQPTTLLTAQVANAAIARGARTIAYDTGTGTAPNFALIQEGQTLEVDTNDGTKKVRVKTIVGDEVTGTITCDENGIEWGDDDVLRIKHEYRLWPVFPRISSGVFYKYYSLTYSDQNSQPPPVAIAGPHRAGFLSAGSIVFAISGSASYAIASGATISSYAWACTGGTIANAAIASTTITFNTAGTYWLKLTVTDSNGKTQSTFRVIFVHGTASMPYRDFTVSNLSGNWDSGGYRLGLSVTGNVTASDFPDGTLAVLWYVGQFDNVEGYVNLLGTGDNIICAGYIDNDNDTDDYKTGAGKVEFEVVTPEALLDQMTDFGSVSITATASPATWYEYASWLTVGRAVHHQLRWQSTAFSVVDILGLTTNTLGVKSANFSEQSLLQRVNGLSHQRGIFSKLISDRAGRLHLVADSQMLNDAARAALDTVFSITNSDISGAINLTRKQEEQAGSADIDGFSFNGTTSTPLISIAPGYIDTITITLAEFRGTQGITARNQVLASQTDSNEKAGRLLAVENNPINEIRLTFRGNYLGAFDIVPNLGWYTWGIANNSLKRGLSLNGVKLLCRSVSHQIDVENGTLQTSAIFETEAIGADGIPGNYPTTYPTQNQNPPDPTWQTEEPGGGGAIMAYSAVTTEYGTAVLLGSGPASIGTPAVFSTETVGETAVCGLSATQAMVVYQNTFASNFGRACVLDVSGATITPGTPAALESGAVSKLSVCALSATKAIAVYNLGVTGLRAVILDVSGSTVTPGTAVQVDASAGSGTSGLGVIRLSATKAIAAWSDAGSDNDGEAAVLDISGSTITPGAVYEFHAGSLSDYVTDVKIAALGATQAVVVYNNPNGGDVDVVGRILDVSGTVITPGSAALAFTGSGATSPIQGHQIVDMIDSTHFVIIATWRNPSNLVRSAVGTVAASVITYGTEVTLTGALGASTVRTCCIIPVAGTALYAYRDNAVIYVASVGISGTTITDNNDDTTSFSGDYLSMGLLETI